MLGETTIELVDVSFAHRTSTAGRYRALSRVSLRVAPRTMTAVVGPSGAGKSTLAKLVCRFWDVDTGSAQVCGIDVRDMPHAQLMGQVALVLQETFLFDDTVAANLRLARPDATDAQLEAAARAARAHEFVSALPQGTPPGSGSTVPDCPVESGSDCRSPGPLEGRPDRGAGRGDRLRRPGERSGPAGCAG